MSIKNHDITASLQEIRDEYNLSEEESKAFVSNELNTASSALRSTGWSKSTTSPADIRGRVTKVPFAFAGKLTGKQQEDIKQLYPDFEIIFKQERKQAHAAAACSRALDRALLKKRAPAGQRLISVGGNYEYELLSSEYPVHSCTPDHSLVGDAKEAARDVKRMQKLRAFAKGKGCTPEVAARVQSFLADQTPWRCRKLVQDCDHAAGVIMMAHVYDITLEQLVKAMVSHGAKLVMGCVLFTNDMLIADSGKLPHVDGYFHKKNGKIHFGFENESQWEYSHDWESFKRYGFGGAVVQYEDRQAFYSITEQRGDTLYFMMTLAPTVVKPLPVKKSWRVDEKKRAVVNGFVLSDTDRTTERRALRPMQFSYPYDPFVKSLAYAIDRMEKGSFSLEDLQRKVRAVFADTTINSVRVTGFSALDDDQMAYFLSNVGILAALSVHSSTADELALLDGVKAFRCGLSQGLFVKAGAAVRKFFAQPFSNTSPVYVKWRALVNCFFSANDEVVSAISWSIDMGYRSAEIGADSSRFDGGAICVGGDYASEQPSTDEVLAMLASAAANSDDFAMVLAEVAASIEPNPELEQWATNLRAKFDVAVDEAARAAERDMVNRMEDPDVLFGGTASSTAVEGKVNKGKSREVAASAPTSADEERIAELTPALVAAETGIGLDENDEVSLHPQDPGEVEAVANAAITEAIQLTIASEKLLLGECRKNHEQVTHGGLPSENALKKHGKLNFEPDFWQVTDGKLAYISFSGKVVNSSDKYFLFAGVYVPSHDVIVRVATHYDKDEQRYSHHVVLPDGTRPDGLVMTTTKLEIYNGPVIISNMRNALAIPLRKGFTLAFVEGVPGCGKTHYIIHNVPSDGTIIACGRENADTTRKRVVEYTSGSADVPDFSKPTVGIRTLDAALMRPTSGRTGTMFLDECFQDHAGKFWAVIKLWGAVQVQALGDRQQIPYIDRAYTGLCHMPRLSHWSIRVGKYLTRRCPRDATMAVSGFYGRKIRTTSQINSSLVLELNTTQVPNLEGWKYLTMLQEDKMTLLAKGYPNVNTVGEVQGQTYENVALVRIQERDQPLYSDENQVDVVLSRHTKRFVYYAPDARNDLVQRLVEEATGNISLVDKYGDVSTVGKDIFNV